MTDEDENFGGSLVLDFRKRWCHMKTIYKIISIVNIVGGVANRFINATYLPASVQKNEWLVYMTSIFSKETAWSINVILPHDSAMIYLYLWKDQKL